MEEETRKGRRITGGTEGERKKEERVIIILINKIMGYCPLHGPKGKFGQI